MYRWRLAALACSLAGAADFEAATSCSFLVSTSLFAGIYEQQGIKYHDFYIFGQILGWLRMKGYLGTTGVGALFQLLMLFLSFTLFSPAANASASA